MVDNGSSVQDVLAEFEQFLVDHAGLELSPSPSSPPFLFVTCGDWDLRSMLPGQLSLLGILFHSRFFPFLVNLLMVFFQAFIKFLPICRLG